MKFCYSAFLSPSSDTGEEILVFRPEVPLRVIGPAGSVVYMALVDTGADHTILPMSIARELKILTKPCRGPAATAFGGQELPLSYADVEFELTDDQVTLRWFARAQFFDFEHPQQETLVVGHQGFLDFFTAVFDGQQVELDLAPNDDMPAKAIDQSSA